MAERLASWTQECLLMINGRIFGSSVSSECEALRTAVELSFWDHGSSGSVKLSVLKQIIDVNDRTKQIASHAKE